jgi:hypothetical protein
MLDRSQLRTSDLPTFSGTASGWFLPHIRFTAKSSAPLGSQCQPRFCSSARRIPQNRAVLASAPFGSAPEIDTGIHARLVSASIVCLKMLFTLVWYPLPRFFSQAITSASSRIETACFTGR